MVKKQSKYQRFLPLWIFVGMLVGIVGGIIFAAAGIADFASSYIKPFGTIYINLLKFLVVPVVLFSIIDGVVSLNDLKRVGSVGVRTIVYYMVTTIFAVIIGLIIANLFKPLFPALSTVDLEYTPNSSKVMDVIVNIFPSNLLAPLVNADMLPLIVIALFFGAGILMAGKKGELIGNIVNSMNEVVMKIMGIVISISPIGVACLMWDVVAVNGPKIIGALAIVVGVAYVGYIIHILLIYGLSVKLLAKMNPFRFFKGMASAMITAFTTTSSAATIPVNMECCNSMGAEPEISSFCLPLGATINMDGTAIYQAVAAIFIATCYGVDLTFGQMVTIVLTATLASIGTAGAPGSGMIMLSMVLVSVGLPVEGIALIAGVDKLFDMGRTTLNITGDATCVMWISRQEKEKKAQKKASKK